MKNLIAKILVAIGNFFFRMYYKIKPKGFKNIVGIPYERDPDNPCEGYEPFGHGLASFHNCETDGHYLCRKCCHKIAVEDSEYPEP